MPTMKIKAAPEDFIVEEMLTLPEFQTGGAFTVFRLDKKNLSTLDALNLLARRYRIRDADIGFAGIKDKYAVTSQFLSIRGGRKLGEIRERNFTLVPLGEATEPLTSAGLQGNKFTITVRNLDKGEIARIGESLGDAGEFGFPNYFGEQRFGSARAGAGFIAKFLMRGDFENALKLYLASRSDEDKSGVKGARKFIGENWGNWDACLKFAQNPDEREIFRRLKLYPRDFIGAVNLINRRLLHLYISAYQSFLWNETAAGFIKKTLGRGDLRTFAHTAGEMVFYGRLGAQEAERLGKVEIPILDHKSSIEDAEIKSAAEGILEREGIEIAQFKLPKIKNAFFKSAARELIVRPSELRILESAADEMYPPMQKFRFSFTLPPGSYASVLLRRVGG